MAHGVQVWGGAGGSAALGWRLGHWARANWKGFANMPDLASSCGSLGAEPAFRRARGWRRAWIWRRTGGKEAGRESEVIVQARVGDLIQGGDKGMEARSRIQETL